mgnify:CR=1 FL=1
MEPALLKVLMSHNLTTNSEMKCALRSGERRIEYNPELCRELPDNVFEEMMKAECIRILLKHPYERQPEKCPAFAVTMGSDCVIADNYRMKHIKLTSPKEIGLKDGQHFEYYAREIEKQLHEQGSSGDGSNNQVIGEQSAMWKEDAMVAAEINEMISNTKHWGSLAGKMEGAIIASSKVKIDYRRVLQAFRSEVLGSKRRLTRMKPNRRSGFENLGSLYSLTSRLLVAVDVSGSIQNDMIGDFFGIINRFFKYGIEEIEAIQFDATIQGEPMSMKKARNGGIDIVGRGGTNYQPMLDYAASHKGKYQGLVIFTDGHADKPVLPNHFRMPILWVLPFGTEKVEWMERIGRVCLIER